MIPDFVLCFTFGFSCVFEFSCAFSCGLPSVSLLVSLLVLFPPGSLLCAPPPRYHTSPPPSSLSSHVPRLFISVRVFHAPAPVCSQFPMVCVLDLSFAF